MIGQSTRCVPSFFCMNPFLFDVGTKQPLKRERREREREREREKREGGR